MLYIFYVWILMVACICNLQRPKEKKSYVGDGLPDEEIDGTCNFSVEEKLLSTKFSAVPEFYIQLNGSGAFLFTSSLTISTVLWSSVLGLLILICRERTIIGSVSYRNRYWVYHIESYRLLLYRPILHASLQVHQLLTDRITQYARWSKGVQAPRHPPTVRSRVRAV